MKDLIAGHVYVIERSSGYVKIGKATNPQKRIRDIECQSGISALRTWVSQPCGNYSEIEKKCHYHLANKRGIGEYFHISFDEAVDFVEAFDFSMLGRKKAIESRTVAARVPNLIAEMCHQAAYEAGMTLSAWVYNVIFDPLNE